MANEYLDMLQENETGHGSRLAASINLAEGANPDEIARQKRIAKILKQPLAAVQGDPDTAKSMAQYQTIERDTEGAPATRQKYTDADFTKLAQDDSANLGIIERTARNLMAGYGADFAGSGVAGLGNALNSIERLAINWKNPSGGKSIFNSYGEWKKENEMPGLGDKLVEIGETAKKHWNEGAPQGEQQTFSDQVVRGIGQLGGQLPVMMASAPLGVGLMYGQGADIMSDKIAKDKKAQKTSQMNQDLEILSGGAITAVTEWATSKLLLKPPQMLAIKNKLLSYSAKVALGATEEGIQEMSENILQDVAHISLTNPDSKVAFGEALHSGGVGAIVGALASGVINGALHIRTRGMQKAFSDLNDASTVQKLRERSPEDYQGFADAITSHLAATSDGPVNNIYIDANILKGVLAQNGIDPDALGKEVPSIGKQLDEAAVTGGDVVIPLNEYVGKVAGTEVGDMLVDHLRSAPDALSLSELQKAGEIGGDIQSKADAFLAKHAERSAWLQSANDVHKNIFDQLQSTGTYSPAVSRTYASLVRDFYTTLAQSSGMSPMEAFEAHPYKITAGDLSPQGVMQGGQANIESPEFKQWFGDSKVVDGSGKPLVVYHGRENVDGLKVFDMSERQGYGRKQIGAYFTSSKEYAESYPRGENNPTIAAYLDIKNPYVAKSGAEITTIDQKRMEELKAQGYDGVIFKDGVADEYLAFSPTQIKSVYNRGTFDPNDPNILHQTNNSDTIDRVEKIKEGLYVPDTLQGKYAEALSAGDLGTVAGIARRIHETVRRGEISGADAWERHQRYKELADKYIRPLEEAALREWAAASHLLIDPTEFESRWADDGKKHGQEHDVYFDTENQLVYKANNFSFHDTYLDYFNRLAIHNTEFPETAYQFEGFVERNGKFEPVATQRWIRGHKPTIEQSVKNMLDSGFEPIESGAKPSNFKIPGTDIIIRDVHGDNTRINDNGDIFIIDPVIELDIMAKTERLKAEAGLDVLPESKQDNEIDSGDIDKALADWDKSTLFQGGKRAGFDPSTLTTILTKESDYSSFLHETAHFFLTTYADLASRPDAPTRVKEDMTAILEWFGVGSVQEWNAMSLEQQRKFHEQFAYNFEIYQFEGKAPSLQMQGVFERFSAWLKKVYRSIRDELNEVYKAENGQDLPGLTEEVRGVMDRMLATDQQINQAEKVRQMVPMFLTQEESGMDDNEWEAYKEMQKEAHADALSKLQTASLKEMQWLDNAKSRLLKQMQAKNSDIRKRVLKEVTEEVNNDNSYRAFEAYDEAKKSGDPAEIAAVLDAFGYETEAQIERSRRMTPDKHDFIKAMVDKRMLEEYGELSDPAAMQAAVESAIHNEARARFTAVELRFLSKTSHPARVMQEAARQAARSILNKKAIGTIHPSDFTAAEAKAAAESEQAYKKTLPPESVGKMVYTKTYNKAIESGADEATAAEQATTASVEATTRAQQRLDEWAEKYGDAQPIQIAIQAKEHQLLQQQLASEALKANAFIAKQLKFFKRVFGNDKKLAGGRDMNYVLAARAILAHYGFGSSPDMTAAGYLEKIKLYDSDFYDEIEPMVTVRTLEAKPVTELTLEEFTDLYEQIDALWHLSRRTRQIEIDGKLMNRREIVDELISDIEQTGLPVNRPGYNKAISKWENVKIHLMGVKAALRRVEFWADAMDKGHKSGGFKRYIWNPISEAVAAFRIEKGKFLQEYLDIIKDVEPILKGGEIEAPEIGYTFQPHELLHAILHTGNESNKRKLLLGRKWATDEDGNLNTAAWDRFIARAIEDGIITKTHYDFAQRVWDLLEKMKPAAQKAHREMYGYYFAEITANPFETPFGTYAGGYVPAVTDPMIVTDAAMNAEKETQMGDNSFMFPTTGRGFTKGRVEYNKPLLLNLGYFPSHIDKVLRFSVIEPKIKDVARIVKTDKRFADAMDAIDPAVRGDMLVPWLQRTAMQLVSMPIKGRGGNAANWFFRTLRNNTGLQMMVANISNTLQQFTGISIAALHVKPANLRNALWQYVRQPKQMAEMISEKSSYMQTRMSNQQFEIQKTVDELLLNPTKYEQLREYTIKHGYFMQQATQNVVDTITWMGAYNEACEGNVGEKEAVRRADRAVRMTQGSFAPEDVSRFETGSPFVRAFTQFYSYFNMQANLLGTEFSNVARNYGVKRGAGRLLYVATFGYIIPAFLSEAIVQACGGFDAGDDDEYDLGDFMKMFFTSQLRPLAAMVPGIGPAMLAGVNTFNSKPYDDRISTSPAISAIEATVRAPHSIYKALADEGSWSRASRDFLTGLGMLSGLPLGQAGKPIGYSMDVMQGKVNPESGMDMVRGLISGKDVNRKQ